MHWCLTEPQYKPASHLARLRGVTRVHRRAHLRFVDLAYVVDACKGIVRLLIEEHGPEIMEVRRKEPLQPWMLRAWLHLPYGTRVGKHTVGNNLAWLLATHPNDSLRNGAEALELATAVVAATGGENPQTLDTLAAAQAETGDLPAAIGTIGRAIAIARAARAGAVVEQLGERLESYRAGRPFREKPGGS